MYVYPDVDTVSDYMSPGCYGAMRFTVYHEILIMRIKLGKFIITYFLGRIRRKIFNVKKNTALISILLYSELEL